MANKYDTLTQSEKLNRAWQHIFSTGIGDSANQLCCLNMKYGLAKIHQLQANLGMEPNATFIGAPDATITRNIKRWRSGFGYGGKLSWGDGSEKFVILDSMPNACGMLVGGINEIPDLSTIINRVNDIMTQEAYLDNIKLKWDFAVSNHFIDLFEFRSLSLDQEFPCNYAFIIHGSVPELKGDNQSKFEFGLYTHHSEILKNMAEKMETSFGELEVLLDNNAETYLEFVNYACALSQKKRSLAAELLFDDYVEICNPIHQGLINMNEIALGCHPNVENSLFPLVLRADLPAYLLYGKPNFTEESIEFLGFKERAEKNNVMKRLLNANILPHGGGYMFPHILGVNRVLEAEDGHRYFVTDMASGHESEKVFSNPRELQFAYRGRQVLARTLELQLGTVAANLMPKMILKV